MAGDFITCRPCRGTGVIQNDVRDLLFCPQCTKSYGSYMVVHSTWEEAGLGPRDNRCLDCLALLLKRGLRPSDFNLSLSINDGIRWGLEMAASSPPENLGRESEDDAAIEALFRWRDDTTDRYGDDLVGLLLYEFGTDNLTRHSLRRDVPPEHQAGLKAFQALPEEVQVHRVKAFVRAQ